MQTKANTKHRNRKAPEIPRNEPIPGIAQMATAEIIKTHTPNISIMEPEEIDSWKKTYKNTTKHNYENNQATNKT